MNLAHFIEHHARQHPDRVAVSLGSFPHATYRQLARRMRAISHYLRVECRLPPRSHVGLAMTNHPAFWEILFGAWHAGIAAVPINPKLHRREIEFILAHCGAALCFVTADLEGALAPLALELDCLNGVMSVAGGEYHALVATEVPDSPPHPCPPTDIAWIFYTSGTTGRPKGAMLSHRNLLMMIMAHLADIDTIGPGDSILHGAPQSHGSGMLGLAHFAKAANNVIPESGGFNTDECADLLNRYGGMTLFAAPTMVNRLVANPAFVSANLGHLKTIVYGGAPMYQSDCRRAIEAFGPRLAQIYGQGEAPMTITALPKAFHRLDGGDDLMARLASVGTPRTGVEVAVVDESDTPLPAGEVGQVVVRGDVVMKGYWYEEGATARTLSNGWLHTGDVGSFDRGGFLTLLDRSKDLIISGGSNIYPREIEELLLLHPAVREVAVIGRPNTEWGEEVIAFVVPRHAQDLSEADLDLLCLENIARFKRPRAYVFVDGLPKNSTGKVLKTALREMAATLDRG